MIMHGAFQSLMPITPQGMGPMSPTLSAASTPFSNALSMNPDIAVKAAGQIGAVGTSGIAPLQQASPMALNATKTHSPQEIQKVSKQFESIFLRMMIKEMRSTLEKNPLTGNSKAMEVFQSMQDDDMADRMSQKGIGIGNMVYRQMLADNLRNSQKVSGTSI
jgi:hypothetical protein